MTRNQLTYWENEERKRSNRAQEQETTRSNRARETETNRHNVIVEVETERHNRATENLGWAQLTEQNRHAVKTEQQQDRNLAEQERANLAREQLQALNLNLGWAQLGLGYSQLAETIRSNQTREGQNLMSLVETNRANQERESISWANLDETKRSNEVNESLKRAQNSISILNYSLEASKAAEQARHNAAQEAETHRSNKATEFWKGADVINDYIRTAQTGSKNFVDTIIKTKGAVKYGY